MLYSARLLLVFVLVVARVWASKAARIGVLQTELNYFPHSHMFALEKLSNELAARGHDVVVR
jgi:hypothetical protein